MAGPEYAGSLTTTASGRQCQMWAMREPHNHPFYQSPNFPEGSAGAAANRCRNPDPAWHTIGVWCYTMDPGILYEDCVVPMCGML